MAPAQGSHAQIEKCKRFQQDELHWLPQNGSARSFLKKIPMAPKATGGPEKSCGHSG